MIVPRLHRMVNTLVAVYTGNCILFFWYEICIGFLFNNEFFMSNRGDKLILCDEQRYINQAYGFYEVITDDQFEAKLQETYANA